MNLLPAELEDLVWMWRKGVSLKMENHEEQDKTISWKAIILILAIPLVIIGGWQLANDRLNSALDQLIPDWKLPIAAQCDKANEQFVGRAHDVPLIDKQLILSDLHEGTGNSSDDALFDGAMRSLIGGYVDRHGTELILAGDILELAEAQAQRPLNPVILEKIKRSHPVFFRSLKEFLKAGGRLVYVAGNHDMPMVLPAFQKAFLEQIYGDHWHFLVDFPGEVERIKFVAGEYLSNETLIMHGQQQDSVNWVKRAGVHSKAGSCWFDESKGIDVIADIRSLEECAPWIDNAQFIDLNSGESWDQRLKDIVRLFKELRSSGCTEEMGEIGQCIDMASEAKVTSGPAWSDVWDICYAAAEKIQGLSSHGNTSDALVNYARNELKDPNLRVVVAGHTHETREKEFSNGKWFFNTGTWTPHTYDVTTWGRAAGDWESLRKSPKEALRPQEEWKIVFGTNLPYVQVNYAEPTLQKGLRCIEPCRKFFASAELRTYAQTYLRELEGADKGDEAVDDWWSVFFWIVGSVMVDLLLRARNAGYRKAIPLWQEDSKELASHLQLPVEVVPLPETNALPPIIGPLVDFTNHRELFNLVLRENDRLRALFRDRFGE